MDPKGDTFLSMQLAPGCLRTLRSVLSQHSREEDRGSDYFKDMASIGIADSFAHQSGISERKMDQLEFLRNHIFFKPQHLNPKGLVRAPVHMESDISASDFAVEVHSLLAVDLESRQVVVDSAPVVIQGREGRQQFGHHTLLFSPNLLSLETLMDCNVWSLRGSLKVFLNPSMPALKDIEIPQDLRVVMPEVLHGLSTPTLTGHYEVRHCNASRYHLELLKLLREAGCVEERGDTAAGSGISEWRFTTSGKRQGCTAQTHTI